MFLASMMQSCFHIDNSCGENNGDTFSYRDNFFLWQNGAWLQDNKNNIPQDQNSWGVFSILRDRSIDQQISILDDLRSSLTKKELENNKDFKNVAVIYDASLSRFEAWRLGQKNFKPLQFELEKLNRVFDAQLSHDEYVTQLSRFASYCFQNGIHFPLNFSSIQDFDDSKNRKLSLYGGSFVLPERSYYFDKNYETQRKYFLDHLDKTSKILKSAGFSVEDDFAQKVFIFDTLIAKYSMTSAQSRLYDRFFTKTTLEGVYEDLENLKFLEEKISNYQENEKTVTLSLEEKKSIKIFMEGLYSHLNLKDILKSNFEKNYKNSNPSSSNTLFVFDGDYIKRVFSLLLKSNEENKSMLKAYMQYRMIDSVSSFCSKELHDEFFDFYSSKLAGQSKQKTEKKQSTALVNAWVGEILGKAYVKQFFTEESKLEMKHLVSTILDSMRNSLEKSSWLSSQTRVKALAKLENFKVKIAYPDVWQDFSDLSLNSNISLYDISKEVQRFSFKKNFLDQVNAPHDTYKWAMSPQTVNAYYSPMSNEIVFPAAILQSPFFQSDLTKLEDALGQNEDKFGFDPLIPINYGAIGAVIAHEITHGYDDQGRKFDAKGNLIDWWSKEDFKAFTDRSKLMLEQAESYSFSDESGKSYKMNGHLTMGENLADLGGMTLALRAMYSLKDSQTGNYIYKNKKATRLFFRSWANIWKEKSREQTRIQRLSSDPHAPSDFRGNLVRNLDEFHESFDIQKSDAMYLEPSKRVRMW